MIQEPEEEQHHAGTDLYQDIIRLDAIIKKLHTRFKKSIQ